MPLIGNKEDWRAEQILLVCFQILPHWPMNNLEEDNMQTSGEFFTMHGHPTAPVLSRRIPGPRTVPNFVNNCGAVHLWALVCEFHRIELRNGMQFPTHGRLERNVSLSCTHCGMETTIITWRYKPQKSRRVRKKYHSLSNLENNDDCPKYDKYD